MISFDELYEKTRGNAKMPERLLCIDPGETTGWCLFEHHKLVRWGQIKTVNQEEIDWDLLDALFVDQEPDCVICEDYRVYAHKLERHTFSSVPTLRLIGGIDLMCNLGWYSLEVEKMYADDAVYSAGNSYYEHHTCSIYYQMATQAKGFVTDDRLKEWGFWQEGMRHSRDAIRHGCYFLLFHKRGKDVE